MVQRGHAKEAASGVRGGGISCDEPGEPFA